MNQHTSTGGRRESIESIAVLYGIQPDELTATVAFTLGQIEYAKVIAISEGCGSGELPDRLRARVDEREQELRRLLDEQGQQKANSINRDDTSNQTFAAGVAYGLRYAVQEMDDGGVAEIERQAAIMEARAEGKSNAGAVESSKDQPAQRRYPVSWIGDGEPSDVLLACSMALDYVKESQIAAIESGFNLSQSGREGLVYMLGAIRDTVVCAQQEVEETSTRSKTPPNQG